MLHFFLFFIFSPFDFLHFSNQQSHIASVSYNSAISRNQNVQAQSANSIPRRRYVANRNGGE